MAGGGITLDYARGMGLPIGFALRAILPAVYFMRLDLQ
jgi:hypothetical protein